MTVDGATFFPIDEVPGAELADDGAVVLTSGPGTDLFVDPSGDSRLDTATVLTRTVEDPAFQFSARVRPGLEATFDGGVLFVRADADHWAKLCLERSTAGEPTAVSVVTRVLSDDANGWVLPGPDAWLRISRDARTFALHVSVDGTEWDLVRYFSLPAPGSVEVGLLSQSPTGEGCRVVFSDLRYVPEALEDPRSNA